MILIFFFLEEYKYLVNILSEYNQGKSFYVIDRNKMLVVGCGSHWINSHFTNVVHTSVCHICLFSEFTHMWLS